MKKLFLLMPALRIMAGALGQSDINDETVVRSIADRILAETQYGFVTRSGSLTYNTAIEVPEDTLVNFKSRTLDWHYTNGVINMAMADLGDFLHEDKYARHCVNQIYFAMDTYRVFEGR